MVSDSDTLRDILSSFTGERGELIPILQKVQKEFGYLPEDAMKRVARFLKTSESTLYGVATFYTQFRLKPAGRKKVMVCRGTACHVNGAQQILEEVEKQLGIKEGETTPDNEYSLNTVACIGCCSLSPTIMIDEKVEANLTRSKVEKVFSGGEK